MKKVLVAFLVLAMMLSFTAFAEKAEFDGFTVDIPSSFKGYDGNDSSHSVYIRDNGPSRTTINISRYDSIFSSLDDAVSQLADMFVMDDYETEQLNVNGTHVALIKDSWFDENKAVIFEAGNYYYSIEYEVSGSWDNAEKTWDKIIQSISVTAKQEEASDITTEEAEEEVYDYPTLEKGSKGDEVKTLQQRLVDLYWLDGSVDGNYGNKTKDAVERFQSEAGLPITGVADGKTQAKLFADDAPEASMSVSCSSIVMGNYGETAWYVNGQSFTLKGNQTKKLKTPWGTYVFDALGEYKQID